MFLVYSFFLFFFCGPLFSQEKTINGVVAVVGGWPVFVSDVNKKILEIEGEYLKRGVDFSFSQLPLNEKNVFKKDVLDLLIGDRIILTAAEKDTTISIGYDQISLFLDEDIQETVEKLFNGSVLDFEKENQTTVSKYKADQWDSAKKLLLIEQKKHTLLSGVSVTKKEIFNTFEYYKKENPFIPQSFSFSLYETRVSPEKEDMGLKIKKLTSIKDSIVSNQLLFKDALNLYSKKAAPSEDLNGWWLRGDLGETFPETRDLEKILFGLSVGEVGGPVETRLGFHLFFLEDRAGEKIKIKQLFLPLKDVLVDLSPFIEKQKNLFALCENDPGLFDSLIIENSFLYKELGKENLSGTYNNISFENETFLKDPFYKELSGVLEKTPNYSFFGPFVFKNSVFLLYKLSEEKKRPLVEEDLYVRWAEFEIYALDAKRGLFIEEWISGQKKQTYVKIFN